MSPAETALLVAGVVFGGAIVVVLVTAARVGRRPPEVRLTVTHNALRRDAVPLDRTDPIAVQVGTGADPVLQRLLAVTMPVDSIALERSAGDPALALPVAVRRDPVERLRVGWHDVGVLGKGSRLMSVKRTPVSTMAAAERRGPAAAPGPAGLPDARPADVEQGQSVRAGGSEPEAPVGGVPALDAAAVDPSGPDTPAGRASGSTAAADPVSADPGSVERAGGVAAEAASGTPADPPSGEGPRPGPPGAAEVDAQEGPETGGPPEPADGACASERRVAAERCAVAARAREVHDDAQARQRLLQREYDAIEARMGAASLVMDGRRVMEAKEAARREFRAGSSAAGNSADVESAAARWLATINAVNVRVRDAQRVVAVERRRAARLLGEIEAGEARLDATRIAAEIAEQRCHEARQALAACQELHSARLVAASLTTVLSPSSEPASASDAGRAGTAPSVAPDGGIEPEGGAPAVADARSSTAPPGPAPLPHAAPGLSLDAAAGSPAGTEAAASADGIGVQSGPADLARGAGSADDGQLAHVLAPAETVLALILQGDDAALAAAASELAAGAVDEERRWRLELAALRDACRAAAIEAGAIDLPPDDAFWGTFAPAEAREIAVALASLGYRYDGQGGFADGRVPSTRDLALAVGYSGIDPRRVRRWPPTEALPGLFAGATVAVAAHVAAGAPDLTLGQMVSLLGSYAASLAPLWDAWGVVRPLLARRGFPDAGRR